MEARPRSRGDRWRAAALSALLIAACHPAGVRPVPIPPPQPPVVPSGPPPVAPPERATESRRGTWPPPVQREFRGAWVATVGNIDWPSRPGLPAAEQRAQLVSLLDRAAALGLNAVILQVRPAGDALYASSLEPWSEVLTGAMGQAPSPFYDPLELAVAEAHRRGLELHAWFNPFRARTPGMRSPLAPEHLARRRPDLVRTYGRHLWLDPGEPQARAHSLRVILDVVRRYDIDGVHLDDYFFPYPERDAAGRLIPFPDEASYARYRASGGTLARGDWRRASINEFIRELYQEVRREKPWVKVGISPFGIWRPGHPPGIQGLDAWATLHADARRWLREGWVDYLAPQLYWPSTRPAQSFPALLAWWAGENVRGRHLWPGLIPSRVGEELDDWPPREILDQVRQARSQPGADGQILFSMRALAGGYAGIGDRLGAGPYAEPALVPPSPWLDDEPPEPPRARLAGGVLSLDPAPGEPPFLWVVSTRVAGLWSTRLVPAGERRLDFGAAAVDLVTVAAVDRTGNQGPARVVRPAVLP